MKRIHYIFSIILALLMIGSLLIVFFHNKDDVKNISLVMVYVKESDRLVDIKDKGIIKDILKEFRRKEKYTFDKDKDIDYTYSIEFFSPNTGYGPFYCVEGEDIVLEEYKDDLTDVSYFIVDDSLFDIIESAVKESN